MSCIGEAWCPICREIIYGNGCMCGLACDRGEPRHSCTMDAPDGIWPKRQYGQRTARNRVEIKNGWTVAVERDGGEWETIRTEVPKESPAQMRYGDLGRLPVLTGILGWNIVKIDIVMGNGEGI